MITSVGARDEKPIYDGPYRHPELQTVGRTVTLVVDGSDGSLVIQASWRLNPIHSHTREAWATDATTFLGQVGELDRGARCIVSGLFDGVATLINFSVRERWLITPGASRRGPEPKPKDSCQTTRRGRRPRQRHPRTHTLGTRPLTRTQRMLDSRPRERRVGHPPR